MNDGDWICSDPNCGNINFARRLSCYRCNKEKPDGGKPSKKLGTEIGKSAAEKSRGLFNADDWQCSKCANVNWARRTTCNVCNAPKFGEVEARTGYGGGYNERGVVEYRRREASSDDEYDEFGRKKRKRKSETPKSDTSEKVGTTEGPVFKKLPPTMQQKGSKMEHGSVTAPKNNENEKISGSVSDGSVCEFPPLSKIAFRKNQLQNQTNYYRQDHMIPRSNGFQSRKRYSSTGDRDHTGSSGYETCSKRGKRDNSESPIIKPYSPVMENRVSSTNNEVIYKFTGPTPTENFQVTYTLEERVQAAAFAIVYKNCKISTEKFETTFDKPAPDFKTIFAWRQRLLTTGCLVDAHAELKKAIPDKSSPTNIPFTTNIENNERKIVRKLPNPDEIPISLSSDSDDGCSKNTKVQNKSSSRQRSVSVETLLLSGVDNQVQGPGSSVSTQDERGSRTGSNSRSTHHRSRSSSRDSQDSNYPDSDIEQLETKTTNSKSSTNMKPPTKQSVQDSDSDSVSYNSDTDDFLQRVFKGKKTKRKVKKRPTPIATPVSTPVKINHNNYEQNNVQTFQGYSTAKQLNQSPLATGNIYMSNLQNMTATAKGNMLVDFDGCSSEYVPTRHGSTAGSTAKRNYQEFKNNVKKKGYWAKANGQSISKPKIPNNPNIGSQLDPLINNSYVEVGQCVRQPITNKPKIPSNPTHQIELPMSNVYGEIKQDFKNYRQSITKKPQMPSNYVVTPQMEPPVLKQYVETNQDYRQSIPNIPNHLLNKNAPIGNSFVQINKGYGQSLNNIPKPLNNPVATAQNEHPISNSFVEVGHSYGQLINNKQNPIVVAQNQSPISNPFAEVKQGYGKFNGPKLPNEPTIITQKESSDNNSFIEINEGYGRSMTKKPKIAVVTAQKESLINNSYLGHDQSSNKLDLPNNPLATPQKEPPNNDPFIEAKQGLSTTSNQSDEFLKKDSKFVPLESKTSFDETSPIIAEESSENTSCIFDVVQSNSASKNRSIMDIFDTNEQNSGSPERNNNLDKYDSVRKMYETEWDDDDDALYKNSDSAETITTKKRTPSPLSTGSVSANSPSSNMLYVQENEISDHTSTPKKSTMGIAIESCDNLSDLWIDFQTNKEQDIGNIIPQLKQNSTNLFTISPPKLTEDVSTIPLPDRTPPSLMVLRPEAIPVEMSNEIISLSEENVNLSHENAPKNISSSKKVHIIESITIKPCDSGHKNTTSKEQLNLNQYFECSPTISHTSNTASTPISQDNPTQESSVELLKTAEFIQTATAPPQIDLSNLLSGINTNTLLLALQNLQQLTQQPIDANKQTNNVQNVDKIDPQVETINLTNDEEWENESNHEGSIERQLERMDGNTGDTPFLSDIFDPGPVVVPPHVAQKLNINLKSFEENKDTHTSHLNESAPVIGNFKSFALPKPILLNRLKLTVKAPEKIPKKSSGGKRTKRKGKTSATKVEGAEEEDEEEESGDEADLSKYDLWGSDAEQDSSKTDGDKVKDGESSKEGGSDPADKSASPEMKSSKRRSRSSSSSSSSSTSSSSSHSSTQAPKNKFDDFNLNSEREGSPRGRRSRSRSRSPRSRSANAPPPRRKSRDSRSAGESRSSRDAEWSRDRERRDRSRGNREPKERRYSREGGGNHYGGRGRHR